MILKVELWVILIFVCKLCFINGFFIVPPVRYLPNVLRAGARVRTTFLTLRQAPKKRSMLIKLFKQLRKMVLPKRPKWNYTIRNFPTRSICPQTKACPDKTTVHVEQTNKKTKIFLLVYNYDRFFTRIMDQLM